jgi:hypothetical protein
VSRGPQNLWQKPSHFSINHPFKLWYGKFCTPCIHNICGNVFTGGVKVGEQVGGRRKYENRWRGRCTYEERGRYGNNWRGRE